MVRTTTYYVTDALSLEMLEKLEDLQERLRVREIMFSKRKSKRPISPWTPLSIIRKEIKHG